MMFFTPAAMTIFEQATPAAPTPLTTTLMSLHFLADDLQRIDQSGEHDNCSAVLVVVKDGNVEFFFESFLDLETSRRGDVFEIYAAECDGDVLDRLDDLVRIFCVETNRKSIDAAKFFEQLALPFHHRHRRGRTDIAETKHCRAVRNDGDRVFLYR